MNTVAIAIGAGIAAIAFLVVSGSGGQQSRARTIGGLTIEEKSPDRKDKLVLSDAEWQKRLTPERYRILRNKGTEAAFCSPLNDVKKPGTFHCSGCDLPLFSTDSKFQSGTGWPSFFQPVDRKNVWLKSDHSYGMDRVEVLCAKCDGHLGHVFEDGPRDKTGLRFCINGESLVFKEKK